MGATDVWTTTTVEPWVKVRECIVQNAVTQDGQRSWYEGTIVDWLKSCRMAGWQGLEVTLHSLVDRREPSDQDMRCCAESSDGPELGVPVSGAGTTDRQCSIHAATYRVVRYLSC